MHVGKERGICILSLDDSWILLSSPAAMAAARGGRGLNGGSFRDGDMGDNDGVSCHRGCLTKLDGGMEASSVSFTDCSLLKSKAGVLLC
jgi:hypothetical protein